MNLYQKEIIEHAKKSEQNMRVAILAGLSFKELRSMLIDEFAMELILYLEEKGWSDCDVIYWKNEKWAKFRKNNWPLHVYVGIGPDKNFSITEFCVIAHDKEVDNNTRVNISNILKIDIGNGSFDAYCAWRSKLNTNYSNLNSVEGLMAISKFNRSNTLADLAGRIEAVGKVMDSHFPIITQ